MKAASLEEAYELNQKKAAGLSAVILWLKMSHMRVQTAIDLSGLGLDLLKKMKRVPDWGNGDASPAGASCGLKPVYRRKHEEACVTL